MAGTERRPFDTSLQGLAALYSRHFLAWLRGPRAVWEQELNSVIVAQQRRADFLIRYRDEEQQQRLLHIEFQTLVKKGDPREQMPVRMATYALFVLNRYGQVPDQVLILLKDSELSRQVPDRFEQGRVRVDYDVVRLWEQDPEPLLASGLVGLMPLVPLTRGEDVSSLLERCTAVVESEIESGQERSEVLAVTGLLASLKDRSIVRAFFRTKSMLSLLHETPLFQELTQELVQEADRHARLQFLQHLLEHKFGPLPEDLLTALQAVTDVDALDRLGLAVLDAVDIDAFRQQLPLRSEDG
ncbi:hypothetical protein [Gloeobacter morelensis]|uniref:Rpn family recombination-promoting nuclease/putative transposase n=1 Tax=Gloeobacter morelensis MG652769 TaxID=2781736 RepID=A0ABY3PQ54_9CYAN|nr:hypothetical protein [Gloeobacter morelensis]UFP95843.1 Rpn family recombination-promoting nuclease/putative transposase [Gloeobacter morelensis MG652769]